VERQTSNAIRVANAPVSYGVFEMTVDRAGGLLDADTLLDRVAAAGYAGIYLGPVGYLGDACTIRDQLNRRGLLLVGGWIQLRLTDPDGLRDDLADMEHTLDVFLAACEGAPAAWLPKPTLADAGSQARRDNPGRGHDLPEIGLDDAVWQRLADGVARAAERVRARGLEPTFHHHACTYVEAPHEIERFLELTDVGLCLDTGHILLGGGDPVASIRAWGDRVNHVHLKDASRAVLADVIATSAGMEAVWKRGAFRPLGTADLDTDAVLDEIGYGGWLVVEQDRIPKGPDDVSVAIADQERNRAYLKARPLRHPAPTPRSPRSPIRV
jgi:inosose dehydratase